MIGIKDIWTVRIDIDGVRDVITPDVLRSLVLIDEAGGPLPTFQLSMYIRDRAFAKRLHEDSKIQLWVGKTDNALELMPLRVYKAGVGNESGEPLGQDFTLIGFYDASDYLYTNRTQAYTNRTSDKVLSEIAGRYGLSFECNDNLNDQMTWRQSNVTDRKFVDVVSLHSYGGTTKAFCPAITFSERKFRFMNVPKIMKEGPKWEFTNEVPTRENQIHFEYNVELHRQSGIANTIAGYSRDARVWKMTGEIDRVKPITNPTSVDHIDREKEFTRINSMYWDIGNIHRNYFVAEENNMQKLALYSTMGIILTASNQEYKKIKPLDLAEIVFQKNMNRNERFEEYSGKYLITKVIRGFDSRQSSIKIVMTREGLNVPTDTDSL